MAVRKIKEIYTGYFQKSKIFLHPALGHKRGSSVTPIETYLSWEDVISVSDLKLVCVHHLRNDDEFIHFEQESLLNHSLFEDFKEIGNDKAVYIFDFESYKEDFNHVVNGRYSHISSELKNKIRDFYGQSSANYAFIDSYLYPENYYETYAGLLACKEDEIKMVKLLHSVGELCNKPNFKLETLKSSVKVLDLHN
tara:strand:- start:1659 stop:2243 length:585 start_codon:yes stop_codon:yes gene_type:complete